MTKYTVGLVDGERVDVEGGKYEVENGVLTVFAEKDGAPEQVAAFAPGRWNFVRVSDES